MLSDDQRDQVIANAMEWYGTPYVPKGNVKGVGVDCGRLIYNSFDPIIGPFEPYPNYNPDWAAHRADELYLDFIKPYVTEVKTPLKADLTLVQIGLAYSHAGLYMGNGKYIHAWGRLREGRVTITPQRSFLALARLYAHGQLKHFTVK